MRTIVVQVGRKSRAVKYSRSAKLEPGDFTRSVSNLHRLQCGDAFLRELHRLFDEVVPDAASLGGGKRLDPVDAALADRHLRPAALSPGAGRQWRVEIDILDVHRVKAARVLREVLMGDEALADGRHLELELDQSRIEQSHQDV